MKNFIRNTLIYIYIYSKFFLKNNKKDVIVSIICLLLQIEINKYRCGLAVLTTSAASCDETVK